MPPRRNQPQQPNNQAAQVNQEQPNNRPAQVHQEQPNNQVQQDQRSLAEIFESLNRLRQKLINAETSFEGRLLDELIDLKNKMETMDAKIDLILDRLPEVEPQCSKSYMYIMNNLHEELTWPQTMQFFIELLRRMNRDNQRNPKLEFTRLEMRDRKHFMFKLDIIWDQISPILGNAGTVDEIKNLVLHPNPHK